MVELEQLYKAYFNDVYMYIRKLSQDEIIAEEITSETFFKAMNSLEKFRGDCEIRVWLCQIAKNCYYTYIKKNRHLSGHESIDNINLPDMTDSVEEILINKDDSDRIQKALHGIPEPYKEVFMWRVFGEISFKQIGKLFNKTENWACVTYHRAKKIIKKEMEDI